MMIIIIIITYYRSGFPEACPGPHLTPSPPRATTTRGLAAPFSSAQRYLRLFRRLISRGKTFVCGISSLYEKSMARGWAKYVCS